MKRWMRGLLLLTAVALAATGEHFIRRPEETTTGALLFAAAMAAAAAGSRSAGRFGLRGADAPLTERRPRQLAGYILLLGAGAAGGASLFLFAARGGWLPWVFYAAGVAAFAVSVHLIEEAGGPRPAGGSAVHNWLFIGILLVGVFLRLHGLDRMPPGIYYDEANNALDALWAVESGKYPVYFEGWGGRGPLIMYSLSLAFRLFGANPLALRLTPAFYGLVGLVAVYLLARTLWGAETALAAAFVLAVMRWHVHFSRVAFDAITVPAFAMLSLYFLARGLKRGRRTDFVWSGLFLGWGLMGYAAFRVVPVLVAAIAAWVLANRSVRFARLFEGMLFLVAAAVVASSPLLFYAMRHPEKFLERSRQVYLLRFYPREMWDRALLNNARVTLLMFHQRGDFNPRHNIPDVPMLDPITGALLVLGAGLCLRRFGDWRHGMLLLWLGLALQPGVWSIEAPQGLRNFGATAPVALMSAVFLGEALSLASAESRRLRRFAVGILRAGVPVAGAVALVLNYTAYFHRHAGDIRTFYAFNGVETAVGHLIASMGTGYRYYSIYNSDPTVRFLSPPGAEHFFLKPLEVIPLREEVRKDVLYITDVRYDPPPEVFEHWYPDAERREIFDPAGGVMLRVFKLAADEVNGAQGLATRYFDDAGKLLAQRVEPSPELRTEEAPATVEKVGGVFVPRTGQYLIRLEGSAPARMRLWGATGRLELSQGQEREVRLIQGWYGLWLRGRVRTPQETLRVSFIGEDGKPLKPALFHIPPPHEGLRGFYFEGDSWEGDPVFSRVDPTVFFRWHIVPLPAPFSVEWRGCIQVPQTGRYSFSLFSDSPSRLILDGEPILRATGEVKSRAEVSLEKGLHPMVVRYREPGGYSAVKLYWRPPDGSEEEPIPPDFLIPYEDERCPRESAW